MFCLPFAQPAARRAALGSVLALAALVLAANSCSRFTRTRQCRALIAQVNPALDDVITITHSGGAGGGAGVDGAVAGGAGFASAGGAAGTSGAGGGPGLPAPSNGYVAAAGRYERLAKQLGPMEFGSEEMAKLVAEYAGILTSAAENLRALASALDSNNTLEAERINRELERIGAHERAVVARMDAWCQP